jgi:hypothetical protein
MVARGVTAKRAMNRTEAQYASKLELRRRVGDIAWYVYEGITLRLGDDCRYTPDFAVMLQNGELELHEVKGFWRDDARVKVRAAASMYPFRFVIARRDRGGDGWAIEEIRP